MNNNTVDFATFCYKGDIHRLHQPGQFKRQVSSNYYDFNKLIVVYQNIQPVNQIPLDDLDIPTIYPLITGESYINKILQWYNIDIVKPQYQSDIDHHHQWKYHVVNHLLAAACSEADYIVFADNDCWIKNQPCFIDKKLPSWVDKGIQLIQNNSDCFMVSPNDGELGRKTLIMSQQMFLVKRKDFINANFNQPGFTGNIKDYDTMPEYHSMLEGRIHYHCKNVNKYRYVLSPEYRYWHFNRLTKDDLFELDYSKY